MLSAANCMAHYKSVALCLICFGFIAQMEFELMPLLLETIHFQHTDSHTLSIWHSGHRHSTLPQAHLLSLAFWSPLLCVRLSGSAFGIPAFGILGCTLREEVD